MAKNLKKAWFQGSDESVDKIVSNDPNKLGYPGEVGYDRKPMAVPVGEDSRSWEDKWFNAAANETKKNLGPSGAEFKLKQDLQRIPTDEKIANAKISAGFTRTAKPSESFWTIYTTDKKTGVKTPVLKATLGSIWGKELNNETSAKSATPEYGKAVLAKIGNLGFSKVAYLLTGEKGFLSRTGSMNKKSDALDMVVDAPEGVEEVSEEIPSDMADGLDAEVEQTATEGEVTKEVVESKKAEVEVAQTNLVENTAPESTATVFVELQDAEKMLDEAAKEMGEVAAKLRSKNLTASQKIKLIKLAEAAQEDAISTMTETDGVLEKAQQALEAAEAAIQNASEVAGGESAGEELEVEAPVADAVEFEADAEGEGEALEGAIEEGEGEGEDLMEAASYVGKFLKARAEARKQVLAAGSSEEQKYSVVPDGAPKDGQGEIDSAHPQGGHNLTNVNVGGKPANNGEKFETVSEAQEVDLAVANKMPKGTLNASSKGTVKTASADQAAKKYWADFYGQGDAASKEFGKNMSKDFVSGGNVQAAVEEGQAKVVRAYELAETATEKGFCDRTASAKKDLVKQILSFDDNSFVAFKKMIDSAPVKKAMLATASLKVPNIGLVEIGHEDTESNFVSRLTNIGWK